MDVKVFNRFSQTMMRGFPRDVDLGLRPIEMHVLTLIDHEGDKPLHFYARHVGLEKGSLTYLLEVLEEKGYLKRLEDEHDRRRKFLRLTDKGLEMTDRIKQAEEAYIEKVLSEFSEKEKETLRDAEEIMKQYLTKFHESHPEHRRPRRRHQQKDLS